MTLQNLCSIFDSYYIANHKSELNQRHIASSELIYSDGEVKHHVDKDGYIVIKSVYNADYLIYIDQSGNICLWIYQLTLETKYKEIIDYCNKIRSQTGMYRHLPEVTDKKKGPLPLSITIDQKEEISRSTDNILKNAPAEIVDINAFECTECKGRKFNVRQYDNGVYKYACAKCGTKFTLIPSKYYIISAKTIKTDITKNGIKFYMISLNDDEEEDNNGEIEN